MSSLNQNVIRHKIGLLNLATEFGNVSKSCKVMGLSRYTFYRDQNAVTEGGVDALFNSNRRKPNPKNRVEESTEIAVLAYAVEQPATDRFGSATNYAGAVFSYLHPAFARSGYVTSCRPSS